MYKTEGQGPIVDQEGQRLGQDLAPSDVEIAPAAGIRAKPAPLCPFLDARLDDLDARDGLGQAGAHDTELRTLGLGDGSELPDIVVQRPGEGDDKDEWNESKVGVDGADRDHDERELCYPEDKAAEGGAEHVIERARIIRCPRHQIAYLLAAVESQALAEKVDKELLACIALDPPGQELREDPVDDVQRSLAHPEPEDAERQKEQRAGVPPGAEDVVEGTAERDRGLRTQRGGENAEQDHAGWQVRVSQCV